AASTSGNPSFSVLRQLQYLCELTQRLKSFQEFADIAPEQALLSLPVTGMRVNMLKLDSILADSRPQNLIHCTKGATDNTCKKISKMGKA
ncbi:hypothetical protein, partial [Enterobacter hormaechei]|uniref:hypothetical protein n=1 Tax=Enterobacter hormaechei TaxID=158836 RepID=UPI001EDAFA2C